MKSSLLPDATPHDFAQASERTRLILAQVLPTLTTEELEQSAPISISEPDFLLALAMSAVASEKLAAGIRSFAVDTEKLQAHLV